MQKFEFDFESDAKELSYKIRNDLSKNFLQEISNWESFLSWLNYFYIFYTISEISINLRLPKYKSGIIMKVYRFALIDDELLRKKIMKKEKMKKKELPKKYFRNLIYFQK